MGREAKARSARKAARDGYAPPPLERLAARLATDRGKAALRAYLDALYAPAFEVRGPFLVGR